MKIDHIIKENLPELRKYFDLNFRGLYTEIIRFEILLQSLQVKESHLLTDHKLGWEHRSLPIKSAREQIKVLNSLLAVRKALWSMGQLSAAELKMAFPDEQLTERKKIKKTPQKDFFVNEQSPLLLIMIAKFVLEYSSSDFNTLLTHARILLFHESLHFLENEDSVSIGPLGLLIFISVVNLYEDAFQQPVRYYSLSTVCDLPGKLFFSSLVQYYLLSDHVDFKEHMDIKPSCKDIEEYVSQLPPVNSVKVFFEELEMTLRLQKGEGLFLQLFQYLNAPVKESPYQLFLKKLLNLAPAQTQAKISESHISAFRKIQIEQWLVPRWLQFTNRQYRVLNNKIDLSGELSFALESAPGIELKDFKIYINYIKYLCFLISMQQVVFLSPKRDDRHGHPLHAQYKAHLNLESNRPFKMPSLNNFFNLPTILPYKPYCYEPYALLRIEANTVDLINSWRKNFELQKRKRDSERLCSSPAPSSSASSGSASSSSFGLVAPHKVGC